MGTWINDFSMIGLFLTTQNSNADENSEASKSGLSERIRIHSCLYTDFWRATVCRIIQRSLTQQKSMMKEVVIDQPLLGPKSFKRSGVHNSSCGEVIEIVPSNASSAIWISAMYVSVIAQVSIVHLTSSGLLFVSDHPGS